MWQFLYYRAAEIAAERTREARLARLARLASEVCGPRPSMLSRARRSAALLAARVACLLDESVSPGALSRSGGR